MTDTESARLAALVRQSWQGEPGREDAWHGPSLRKLLEGVGAEEAARHPIAGAHSIWELVLHIAVWDEICARRIGGEVVDATTGSPEDWPAVEETTEKAWRGACDRLARAQTSLAEAVESFGDVPLPERATGCPWTNHRMLHGTLHHDVYHAGQIALLRRASLG